MRKKDRYAAIVAWFSQNMAVAESELNFSSPYELVVAVVLSAQCTDRRVNMTTPVLFSSYPDALSLSEASEDDVYEIIKSISYPRNKARHLVGLGKKLISDFGGEVPSTVEELMTLPGVGRKTANVVASVIYDRPVIAVDTHVFRVAHRLGLSDGKTPLAVEADLEKYIPEEKRAVSHHWLILHGRYVCTARSPKCAQCGLQDWCRKFVSDSVHVSSLQTSRRPG